MAGSCSVSLSGAATVHRKHESEPGLKYGCSVTSSTSSYGATNRWHILRDISVLDCDQNLGETLCDEQIVSTPRRWNSSPYLPHSSEHNTSPKTKKVLTVTQRSRSLTNLSQEYPHDSEKNEHRKGKECREYHLQGQDTGQETEVVVQKCVMKNKSIRAPSLAMRQTSQTFGGQINKNLLVSGVLDDTFDMQAAFAYQKVQVDFY